MDVIPAPDSPKRTRLKSAPPTASKAVIQTAESKPARKKLTTRKKVATPAEIVGTTPDLPLDLSGMIATAAFYLAAERNFTPGHELDDWLEAERRIRALHPF